MKTFKQQGEGSLEGNLEQKIQKLFQGLFLSILDPAAQDGEGGGKMVFHDVVTLPELGFVTFLQRKICLEGGQDGLFQGISKGDIRHQQRHHDILILIVGIDDQTGRSTPKKIW